MVKTNDNLNTSLKFIGISLNFVDILINEICSFGFNLYYYYVIIIFDIAFFYRFKLT